MFNVKYRHLFILALAVYSYLNIFYTIGTALFDFEIPHIFLFGILGFVVAGTWELNRLAQNFIQKSDLPGKTRIHPLILLFLISLFNVLITSFVGLQLLYQFLDIRAQANITHLKLLLAFGFRINLFLACINAIVYYMNRLKQTQLEAEQLKQTTIEAQFEALRSQINPHFLFNCFNVLSSLVYKDADTSARFIGQLSTVYRYLLYNQENKIVPLKDELAFIQSYLYLLTIRFGENIIVENTIADEEQHYVAPAVLQMLIENAIKHNVVSRKNPLTIKLFIEEGFLSVRNNLQEKEVKEESTKVGLKNICDRYKFLSDIEVQIIRADGTFCVRLPLLKVK